MDKDNKNSKTIDFNSIDREKRDKKLNESMTINIYEGKKKTTNDGKIIEFEQAKKEQKTKARKQKTKARKQKIKNAAPKGRSGYIKIFYAVLLILIIFVVFSKLI